MLHTINNSLPGDKQPLLCYGYLVKPGKGWSFISGQGKAEVDLIGCYFGVVETMDWLTPSGSRELNTFPKRICHF